MGAIDPAGVPKTRVLRIGCRTGLVLLHKIDLLELCNPWIARLLELHCNNFQCCRLLITYDINYHSQTKAVQNSRIKTK